jgi:tRNA (mo5U34)-methyltransferase
MRMHDDKASWSNYSEILDRAAQWKQQLQSAKSEPPASDRSWYAYDILSNLWHLQHLIEQIPESMLDLFRRGHVADIGAADGDLSYFLEHLGLSVDLIDWPATNWNGLAGARALGQRLDSRNVSIHEVDLDTQFELPSQHYDLVLFLGILYHLKNPFYILEKLAKHCRFCFLSTRIARQTADRKLHLEEVPVAYLLDPVECNNDATNFWIFSAPGLIRLAERSGWNVRATYRVGDTEQSDPSSEAHDERMFLALESRF